MSKPKAPSDDLVLWLTGLKLCQQAAVIISRQLPESHQFLTVQFQQV